MRRGSLDFWTMEYADEANEAYRIMTQTDPNAPCPPTAMPQPDANPTDFPMLQPPQAELLQRPDFRARILHIEDDPLAADTVLRLVHKWPEYDYLGNATTGAEGLSVCRSAGATLVLLDLNLPDMDGLEVLDQLRADRPGTRVLVLTVRSDPAFLYRVMLGQAAGVICKSARLHVELRRALDTCTAGHSYLPIEIAVAVNRFRRDPRAFFKLLSNREISLLPHFGRGGADGDIATAVGLSPATIHSHRQSVTRKLDLHSSAELMRWCAEHGFSHFPRRPQLDRDNGFLG
jgi:two-component system nitrate/nitrite response regulator NarL